MSEQYLIKKRGYYYRQNCQGYTSCINEAGRYSFDDARAITHPNGMDGPRDGMEYVLAPPISCVPSGATALERAAPALLEALQDVQLLCTNHGGELDSMTAIDLANRIHALVSPAIAAAKGGE